MNIKLVSFDLQGTLCDHAWSSEMWGSLLQAEFEAQRFCLEGNEYDLLIRDFQRIGEDDRRYYDMSYWLKRARSPVTVPELAIRAKAQPRLFPEMLDVVQRCSRLGPVLIVSATTRQFIELELGTQDVLFTDVYSAFDDFNCFGKPPELFTALSQRWGVAPGECLHIGDHCEMDGKSPLRAGWLSLYHPSVMPPLERARRVVEYLER